MKKTSITKVTRPKLSGISPRKRLFKVLDSGREKPVIWVSGPAGSGKTTLVANYLDERKLPCLWYQVDAGDADIATFIYYLGQATQKAAPRYRKPLPLLTPEYLPGLPVFTQRFFEQLYARLKPPFAIVFDNYQEAPEQSPLHELVNIGLSLIPEGIQVFVLSRADPPSAIMRLSANSMMHAVGWDELRFTPEEAKGLVRLKVKQKLTQAAIEELYGKTDGWAAGLVLLLEGAGMPTLGPKAAGSGLQPEVFNYFAGEVLSKLDSETRDFLLMTSFLPTMTERMAEKMTDQDHAGRTLAGLNRNHFFTEKHQTTEPSYQYHALFREFLLMRLKESLNPEGLLRVQNRAAAILEEAGQVEDAAAIYGEAQNWEKYIPLILGHAQALVMQGRSATLSGWLAAVPKEIQETIPWLQYWTGACMLAINPVESQNYFEHAFEGFKKSDDLPGQFLAWSGIADSIFFAGYDYALLDPWFDVFDELLQRHPNFPSQEIEVLVSNSLFGALLYRRPEQAKLAFWEQRLNGLLPTVVDDRLRISLGSFLLNYYMWIGDAAKASQLMDTLRSAVRAHDVSPLAVLLLNNIEAVYCWHTAADFEGCHEIVAQGLKTAELTGVHLCDNLLLSQGCYGALSSGDLPAATDLLGRMKTMLGSARRFDVSHYHFLARWEAVFRDDLAGALEHAQASLSLTESIGIPFPQALSHIALAQVFIIQRNYPEASPHIVSARHINQYIKSKFLEVMCLLLEAWLALEQDDEMECRSSLQAAFTLWKKQGFLNFPWWMPRIMACLCAKALEAGIEVEFVKGIIRKRGLLPPDIAAESNPQSAIRNLQLDNWPWPLKVRMLGRFELVKDGEPIKFTGKVQQKPLALLKALVAFGGKDVPEEQLTDALWPDADGDLAHRSFEMAVHRLRKLIGNDKVIQLQERRLSLDTDLCWVDVWAFDKAAESSPDKDIRGQAASGVRSEEVHNDKSAIRDPQSEINPEIIEKSLSLYKGHFLPSDTAHAWVLSYRERLRSKLSRLIVKLGTSLEQARQWENAAEVFRKGLEADGHAEEYYQHLMVCHQQLGQRAEAISVYNRCRSFLSTTLGIAPSSRTEDLYQAIKNDQ